MKFETSPLNFNITELIFVLIKRGVFKVNYLTKSEPANLLNDINRLFEQAFNPSFRWKGDGSSIESSQWIPAVDIEERKNDFLIKVDLPGIDKKQISIAMENGVITIQGERIEEHQKEDKLYRSERVVGKFYRKFTLPDTANEEKVQANMKNGVLDIVIAKKELAKPRSIDIKIDE